MGTAYERYTGGQAFDLPQDFGANYLIFVQSNITATLATRDGGIWREASLGGENFHVDTSLDPVVTDLYIPFDMIGSPTTLSLVAAASDEFAGGTTGLRLWSSIPQRMPLNSERVVNPLALSFVNHYWQLNRQLDWTSLGAGQCPNSNLAAAADLRLSISADPVGVSAGYLAQGWVGLLQPGGTLDAGEDGQLNTALPMDIDPPPLGDGQLVNYTITYSNLGIPNALGVFPGMTAFATKLMKDKMEKLEVPPVREYLEMLVDAGAKLYACKMSVDVFGLTMDDFVDGVEGIVTAGDFMDMTEGAQVIFI